jgi:hypothetical protein
MMVFEKAAVMPKMAGSAPRRDQSCRATKAPSAKTVNAPEK